MAISVQTLALIILSQSYRGGIVSQINRQSVALKLLPWVRGAGQNVAFVPKGSGVVAEMYLEGAAVTNAGSDAQVKALLPWAMGRANFAVSGLAEATASTSTTPEGNLELWARNMIDGAAALASLLNGEVYTGSGTAPHMVGLDAAIGSLTNTYAGLDRTSGPNAFWLPNVFASAAALTFDLIRGDLASIYIASGARPDLALVHPNVWRKFSGLFDPQKFYTVQTMEATTARGRVSLDGGVAGIRFDGTIFIEDKDAPDSSIYYLNTNHVRMEYLPADLSNVPGADDETMQVQADDGFGETPLGMQLEMLAKTGDAENAMMKSYVQLVVDKPCACGKRSNIT